MNQWIWLIFITCDEHCVNMKTRLNVSVYFLFLNGAKRGVDINVGNISAGNYFVQEVFRRFFRKWKSPFRLFLRRFVIFADIFCKGKCMNEV